MTSGRPRRPQQERLRRRPTRRPRSLVPSPSQSPTSGSSVPCPVLVTVTLPPSTWRKRTFALRGGRAAARRARRRPSPPRPGCRRSCGRSGWSASGRPCRGTRPARRGRPAAARSAGAGRSSRRTSRPGRAAVPGRGAGPTVTYSADEVGVERALARCRGRPRRRARSWRLPRSSTRLTTPWAASDHLGAEVVGAVEVDGQRARASARAGWSRPVLAARGTASRSRRPGAADAAARPATSEAPPRRGAAVRAVRRSRLTCGPRLAYDGAASHTRHCAPRTRRNRNNRSACLSRLPGCRC